MPIVGTNTLFGVQLGLDSLLGRLESSAIEWQSKLALNVASFFATPVKIREFGTRLAFVQQAAQNHGNTSVLPDVAYAQQQVSYLTNAYVNAKPVVIDALNTVDAAQQSGGSVLSSDTLGAAGNAAVKMVEVSSMISAQDSTITALENGTLTPAEAAQLYNQLAQPNAVRNLLFAGGAVVAVWLLLRKG